MPQFCCSKVQPLVVVFVAVAFAVAVAAAVVAAIGACRSTARATGHGPRCCQQQMQSAKNCDTLYKLCRKRQRPIASGVDSTVASSGASKFNQIEQRQRCQGQLRANCLPRQFVGLSHRLTARLATASCLATPPSGQMQQIIVINF